MYPLPENHGRIINAILFRYIWGGNYEPVKRTTVCRAKKEGGLAVINCMVKAKTLYLSTFLKCYTHDNYKNSLMFYYCYIRLSNIIPSEYSIHNASYSTTPYYEAAITMAQSIIHLTGFPFTPKEKIYSNMLPNVNSTAELQYPTFNWKNIWANYTTVFVHSHDREIIYKHLHMCLTTNKRLFNMNLISSSNCNKCRIGIEETALHMLYQCDYAKPLFLWLLKCILNICNFIPSSNIRFLYFDNVYSNLYQKNICNIFIYIYIITIWRTRKENLRIGDLKCMFIRKLSDYKSFIKHMPSRKCEKLSRELLALDIDALLDL